MKKVNIKHIKSSFIVSFLIFALPKAVSAANENDSKQTVNIADQLKQSDPDSTIMVTKQEEIVLEDDDAIYLLGQDPSFISLYLDYGASFFGKNANKDLSTSTLGSRYFNIFAGYNMVIPNSHFSILLGIGYSIATLSFNKNESNFYTLSREDDGSYTQIVEARSLIATHRKIEAFSNSLLNRHYVEFVVDAKLFLDKIYPKDSFSFSAGLKFGMLVSSDVEITYAQDYAPKTVILNDKMNLKDFKIAAHARLAWRRFGLFYEIDLTDTFASSRSFGLKGPDMKYLQKVGLFVDLL